ncbi:hypothetical protein MIND_00561200 [Mycena indigotica]|uniref:Uncharacterized protein n=1 Tax=Mycena indigotica TaxID=2126181 RepID=A0A8H6SNY6_9AGAR|nr:uncharacterized protein MIND_00561200 [Mycena indigotica]KAF7303335.1 hypothetical protein MIND_00561200 [Mycena indigotica]
MKICPVRILPQRLGTTASLQNRGLEINGGRAASVEEVEDEEEGEVYEQEFPEEKQAGAAYRGCKTQFEQLREEQKANGWEPWNPFKDLDEWELARWMATSGLSQGKMTEFLKLKVIQDKVQPSFTNTQTFFELIDSLPSGPRWSCTPFVLTVDKVGLDGEQKTMTLEFWHRNILDCVRELLGNPQLGDQAFEPRRIFTSKSEAGVGVNREYSEMCTGDWWWETQLKLPIGATICPLIIASDSTQLTRFSGDQKAWAVYLGSGNSDADIRSKASSGATVLLGYIPVAKMEMFAKERRSEIIHQLFHDCMATVLQPLKDAGLDGVAVECYDGFVRMIHAILAAYIADYPEQCLVACVRENSCPICLVNPRQRGEYDKDNPPDPRNRDDTLRVIAAKSQGEHPPEFIEQNLHLTRPFWQNLPETDIFSSFTPDLLHEIHNGVFGDHIVAWSSAAMEGVGP